MQLMSQQDNEDRYSRSPDELRAVFPKATPTPSLSQGSPSVSPPNRRAGNLSRRQNGPSMGDVILLKTLGVTIDANENSFHPAEPDVKYPKNHKEAFTETSSYTSISSKKWENVWRKDNRRPSQDLKKTSPTYTSLQKPINKTAVDTSVDINSTLPNGNQPRLRDSPSQSTVSKPLSSMTYNNLSADNRLPSIDQLDQIVRSGVSRGINARYDSRGNSTIVQPLHSTTSKTINPPQLPPICSFPRNASSSTSENSYSPSEQSTRNTSISSVSAYNQRPLYLNGHSSQSIDGVQSHTPSLSSVYSRSDSFSGTDSHSPDTLSSPADSTHAGSRYTRETILPLIRHQDDNYSRLPSNDNKGYKCTFAGCNASSFQTQYLLNSHRNVHSQDRPYFCEAAGCGKGFKRKNELKRHGLSHDSPGYVCPFCSDRDHRYPRPDNLQRHVKGHHNDKQNDPKLRDVLSRKSDGINGQGRRRQSGVYQG